MLKGDIPLLGWGEAAKKQIRLAVEMATGRLSVPKCRDSREIWIQLLLFLFKYDRIII